MLATVQLYPVGYFGSAPSMAGLGPSLLRSAVLVRQLHAVPGFAEHGVRLRSCAIVDGPTGNQCRAARLAGQ